MFYRVSRPFLFSLDAETAHILAIRALRLHPSSPALRPDPVLATRIAGLAFPNPVGLAPGFDKNAEIMHAAASLGFGFAEAGTVTPQAQAGNDRSRLFRLVEDEAVINRMGFNNQGQAAAVKRLRKVRATGRHPIIGINIGANKSSMANDRAIDDYVHGMRTMRSVADYIAINISSPNTPGLRALQDKGALDALLTRVMAAREGDPTPVFLKVAPDLAAADIDDIVALAHRHRLDALIIANTTITRPGALRSSHKGESGGLSGAPLRDMSLQLLRDFVSAGSAAIPLIGVGGIATGEDAYARIRAGASLVQIYSAMVFKGPYLAKAIARQLKQLLIRDGFANVADAVGVQ